jgi:nucleoside-triphosphatase THEP1
VGEQNVDPRAFWDMSSRTFPKKFGSASMSTLTLVAGLKGVGKTTWCARLVDKAKGKGRQASGLLSPGHYHDSAKVAIDLQVVATGERRRLGVLSDRGTNHPSATLPVGRWLFDPEVIAWGNRVLSELGEQDIFVLDELGPLEFKSRAGLSTAFKVIEGGNFREAFIVVRSNLLDQARDLWPHAKVILVKEPPG